MKVATVLFACIFSFFAYAQNVLSGKEIYGVSCKAIVQIKTDEGFGVGFLVSSDGKIITANHVVTTRQSKFRHYAREIMVSVVGKEKPYPAYPITKTPSENDTIFDSSIIQIEATDLPHLTLGSWDDVEVSDTVTVIPSYPTIGCILLQGIVSAKTHAVTDLGWKPVNTIIFQAPIRNGFSGAPIFDKMGRVIGIETTKIFGISPILNELRTKWAPANNVGEIILNGGDLVTGLSELINNLDQNLISGLGSGVAIEYAKEDIKKAQ